MITASCELCSHVEVSLHPALALSKLQEHLEEEHGISRSEFDEELEKHLSAKEHNQEGGE